MPLVNERELLLPALKERRAVGAFNANNMEMVQAFIWAAEETSKEIGRPVDLIIQLSPGASKYAGWALGAGMVKIAASETDVRVALNLDHATEVDQVKKALDMGFTAVLFDGSALPFEENVKLTRQVVEMCHQKGVPVEAELGKIPKIEDYFSPAEIANLRKLPAPEAVQAIRAKAGKSVEELMAKPEDVEYFVSKTGCDFLAAAFGSIHGIWDDIWPVRVDRLVAIQNRTSLPLVSHGSSGILMAPKDAREKGIKLAKGEGTLLDAIQTGGVTKVNVATILSISFIEGFVKAYQANPSEKDFRKLGGPARDRVKEKTKEYIRLFAGLA
ncbi:MAG: class II fructose-bisphosphate aldolase family protein [Candidatus Brockarchaeota archaeon]|nr:class II fructose-bisphosphate aldolase family protein [Candidatus Brockarchaeota archaeon]